MARPHHARVRVPLTMLLGWTLLWGADAALGSRGDDEEIWAIRCITLTSPDRFQRADNYAEALKKVSGMKPKLVQVLSDEDGTAVFYGRYKPVYAPDGTIQRYRPDHLKDIKAIRDLSMSGPHGDVWPFLMASMDLLPTYRSGHPQWEVSKADGYWTLHVAVFYNTDTLRSRRSVAEEYCALLRKQGEEAYYHHAAARSSVYVGTYPLTGVAEVRRENPLSGDVTITSRIAGPSMVAAQKRFPHSLHNGHKMYNLVRNATTGRVSERVAASSFPVMLPKARRQQELLEGR